MLKRLVIFLLFVLSDNVALSLKRLLASKHQRVVLPDAGSWWMVVNDHGKQIGIHESADTSLKIGQTEINNTKAYNFEEDQAIVPVILTCTTNSHFLTPSAANEKSNSTCISIDMLLDVFTPQLVNNTSNSMLRQLEVTLLQKMSDVVCPSTISYANSPSDWRKESQSEISEVQSYKIVSLTSQRFVIGKFCDAKGKQAKDTPFV